MREAKEGTKTKKKRRNVASRRGNEDKQEDRKKDTKEETKTR